MPDNIQWHRLTDLGPSQGERYASFPLHRGQMCRLRETESSSLLGARGEAPALLLKYHYPIDFKLRCGRDI